MSSIGNLARRVLVIVTLLMGMHAAAADRPNVILIMADDVGYECFGCYGSRVPDFGARIGATRLCPIDEPHVHSG